MAKAKKMVYFFGGGPRTFGDFAAQRAVSIGPIELTPKDIIAMSLSALEEYARNGGAGVALAVARRFVNLMGGSLVAESVPGRGSTFRLDLPAAPLPDPVPVAAAPENAFNA